MTFFYALPSISIASCTILAISALLVKLVCTLVYRVTYHPLARFPGPFLAKFTDFYAAYHAYTGDFHLDIHRCHERYGDFVRYGPNRILVNSSQGMHDIYGHLKNVKKAKAYLPMVPGREGWSTLTCIDKGMHRHRRRLISQGLSDDSLRIFEPALYGYLDTFCAKLGSGAVDWDHWTQAKNVGHWCKWLTLDTMGDFGFGQKTGLMDRPDDRYIINVMEAFSWRMGIYEQFPELENLQAELILRIWYYGSATRRKWQKWCQNFVSSIFSPNSDKGKGLFSLVLDSKDPKSGKKFSFQELWAEGSFLMLAGSDTSAITLAALFFYLVRNPFVYEKLAAEIRSIFRHSSDIRSGPTLLSCTYLYACISEALRISPATPRAPWREVQHGGQSIDGHHIPAGYDVATCIYAIHHNEAYFPDSFSFRPERWIPGQMLSAEQLEVAHRAFSPFSVGPRACAGRGLAMLEISLTLARAIWEFDFRLADGEAGRIGGGTAGAREGRHRPEEFQLYTHVTAWCEGPILEFRRRDVG